MDTKNKQDIYWDDQYIPKEVELSEEDKERIKNELKDKGIIE